MNRIISAKWCVSLALAVLSLSACGVKGDGSDGDDDMALSGGSPGTITDDWRSYCIATFTAEYAVVDVFDEPQFTAHVGDEFLLSYYGEGFGDDRATLVYLTADGPSESDVNVPIGMPFPFTTQCEFNNTRSYYGVFTDVSVYAAADLATKICDLSAGTVLPLDPAVFAGYSFADEGFNGPTTYEINLNAFSAQCGAAASGFVSVPQTEVFGSTTWLVPIITIIGPA